jgi:two-component system, cell cycle response regulator DivK
MAGERILVVEDNETNMKLVRDVLQAKGYSTLEATTGEDAVELARTLDPALVLMDVHLPGIDGIEALTQLREDERTHAIPVVAVTAQAMRGDSKRFLDVGFDDYLSKPVDIAELIRVVESTAAMRDGDGRQIEDLRASRKRLVLAAAADRSRIERELHDGPQQLLVALAVELQQARKLVDVHPAAAGVLIDEMSGQLEEAVDALRALAHRIHPPLLEAGGLRLALRTTAAMLDVPTGLHVQEGLIVAPDLAEAVYFSCVDALEHLGEKAKITIAIRQERQTVVFEIVAEGSDSAPADTDLSLIRDRLEALGGALTIQSEPGHTRITGSLPLSG